MHNTFFENTILSVKIKNEFSNLNFAPEFFKLVTSVDTNLSLLILLFRFNSYE